MFKKIIVFMLCIISIISLSACGRISVVNKNTLEKYAKNHKEVYSDVQKDLELSGIKSEDIIIKGNTAIATLDMTKALNGTKLNDGLKKSLKDSFKMSFDYIEDDMTGRINDLENKTKVKDIKYRVDVMVGKEKVYSREFTHSISEDNQVVNEKDSNTKENKEDTSDTTKDKK